MADVYDGAINRPNDSRTAGDLIWGVVYEKVSEKSGIVAWLLVE